MLRALRKPLLRRGQVPARVGASPLVRVAFAFLAVTFLHPLSVAQDDARGKVQLLGGIAGKNGGGVALLKERSTGQIKAVRVGEKVFSVGVLVSFERERVVIHETDGKMTSISSKFGGDGSQKAAAKPLVATQDTYIEEGFKRVGNKIEVDAAYRDHMVKNELPKILMEAASEAVMQDGRVVGFRLFQFEKNSMFEKLGMRDGDVITEINGIPLSSAAKTVQLLNGMKQERSMNVQILRNGQPVTLDMAVK